MLEYNLAADECVEPSWTNMSLQIQAPDKAACNPDTYICTFYAGIGFMCIPPNKRGLALNKPCVYLNYPRSYT